MYQQKCLITAPASKGVARENDHDNDDNDNNDDDDTDSNTDNE